MIEEEALVFFGSLHYLFESLVFLEQESVNQMFLLSRVLDTAYWVSYSLNVNQLLVGLQMFV